MANQYEVDPRQALFLRYYLDPKSSTFSNALQSALKAGYSQEYSESILAKDLDWLAESVGDAKMLKKAEKNLNEFLEMSVENFKNTEDGQIGFIDSGLVRAKLDATKFVSSRLGKAKWSERQELTGKDGQDLFPKPLLGGQSNVSNNDSTKEIAGA